MIAQLPDELWSYILQLRTEMMFWEAEKLYQKEKWAKLLDLEYQLDLMEREYLASWEV